MTILFFLYTIATISRKKDSRKKVPIAFIIPLNKKIGSPAFAEEPIFYCISF